MPDIAAADRASGAGTPLQRVRWNTPDVDSRVRFPPQSGNRLTIFHLRLTVCVLAVLGAASSPALAGLTERELANLAFEPPADARIPANLVLEDASGRKLRIADALDGRPALVIPVDFNCRTLCGPALTIASAAIAESGLRPGQDFQIIIVGLDPRDSVADARALVEAQIADSAVAAAAIILRGDNASTQEFLDAIGYRVAYDAEADQLVHPAGALVSTADGRLARVLSTIGLNPLDLRLAIIEAAQGRLGGLGDRLTLLCSQFDPVHGIYTAAIGRILQVSAAATAVLLGAALLWLHIKERRA
jgi:protein SCO1/2